MTDLARKSADGLLPIEDSVDQRKDIIGQILTGSGLEGSIFSEGFFFCVKVVFAVIG